jgi:hypothetical protein
LTTGKRIKEVAKQTKQIDRISSHMNLCQAIVKPDYSKPKVQKAQGIQKALVHLFMSEIVLSVSENEENLTPANSRVAYFADFARNDGIVLLPNITVS